VNSLQALLTWISLVLNCIASLASTVVAQLPAAGAAAELAEAAPEAGASAGGALSAGAGAGAASEAADAVGAEASAGFEASCEQADKPITAAEIRAK
jgi:hypothetical protein